MEALRVSTGSNPNAVAGAIAGVLRSAQRLSISVVGAGALNQAIKAVAIARLHLLSESIEIVCVPSFVQLVVEHRGAPQGQATAAAERPVSAASILAPLLLPAPVSGWFDVRMASLVT